MFATHTARVATKHRAQLGLGGWVCLGFWLNCAVVSQQVTAAEPAWQIDRALEQQFQTPLSLTLSGVPLRDGLEKLARATRVAMRLDRRIDPARPLEIRIEDEPLERTLDLLAADHQLAWVLLGPVVYFGPAAEQGYPRQLEQKLTASLARLPPTLQKRMLATRAWRWDDLAEPRTLLAELARSNRLEIRGLEEVPHDLWPAAELPPMSLVDRLVLIAIQFDLDVDLAERGAVVELNPRSP